MNKIGTITIDELGRIILPKKLRQKYGLRDGDKVTLWDAGGGTLLLKPAEQQERTRVSLTYCDGMFGQVPP